MIRFVSILIMFVLSSFAYSASAHLNSSNTFQDDSTEFLYEFDMRYIGSSVHIDFNYRYVLGHLIELLDKNPSWTLHIRGHVCCGPSDKISKKRAKNVYKYFKHAGIAPERLSYKGYSDSLPKAFPEKTEADEAQNRRVDFIIRKM